MAIVNTEKKLSADQIADQAWEILSTPVHADEAHTVCGNCGYGLVELPRPIRLRVTAEGIGGGYLKTEFMDFAHWADDEDRIEDAAEPGYEPCAEPEPLTCCGLHGTGCEGRVQFGEDYCGACLTAAYGGE